MELQIKDLIRQQQPDENNVKMEDSSSHKIHQNSELVKILKDLLSQSEISDQKEEFRKKYENYKKLFMNEKLDKECKAKELEILKEQMKDEGVPEIKELRVKYDNLKQLN